MYLSYRTCNALTSPPSPTTLRYENTKNRRKSFPYWDMFVDTLIHQDCKTYNTFKKLYFLTLMLTKLAHLLCTRPFDKISTVENTVTMRMYRHYRINRIL